MILSSPVKVQVFQAYAAATHELIRGTVFIVNLQLIYKRERLTSTLLFLVETALVFGQRMPTRKSMTCSLSRRE